MSTIEREAVEIPAIQSAVQLEGIDYVELYVGNAYQAAHFYRTMFGFKPVARAGLETGLRDRLSIVMEQGDVRLVLTSGLEPDSEITRYAALHGDAVKDVAFRVKDVESAYWIAVRRGATPVSPPQVHEDEHGRVVRATIGAPGETVHSLVERQGYGDTLFPGFEAITDAPATRPIGFTEVDHVAVSMESGQLDQWIAFYKDVLGFRQSHHEMVWTKNSSMNSKVVEGASGKIKFPIQEPSQPGTNSQVQEYLNFNHGSGAQHVAFLCDDIRATVRAIRENGVNFLDIPPTYYEVLEERVGAIEPSVMAELQELGILVDSDDDGRLLQIFSEPITSRPTMFVEVIERQGAQGFGSGNIKALFEAVERQQERRGTI
jgi:4-hydroxyphenylpyruvate dioxygenase